MDPRPPPEITIEGGPGWQLEGVREALGPDDVDVAAEPRGSWLDRHRVGALALAAVVGFAAATALADLRTSTIEESPEGVLSLEVELEQVDYGGSIASDADGELAVTTSVVIRNTGPRPIAFERAELLGTPYRSDDLSGRRVVEGGKTVIALLRRVDCSRLERTRAPGPLRVHATTGSGTRTVDLRMSTDVLQFHDDQVRGSCGQAPPDQALVLNERRSAVEGTTLVLDLGLSNASARPLALEALTPARGLRVASLTSEDGASVDLPLALDPGDFDPPVEPYQGRGPEAGLQVQLEVEDCELFLPPARDVFEPALTTSVTGGTGMNGFGTDPALLQRLRQASCGGETTSTGLAAAPLSADDQQAEEDAAERAYFSLRQAHPFLTPD